MFYYIYKFKEMPKNMDGNKINFEILDDNKTNENIKIKNIENIEPVFEDSFNNQKMIIGGVKLESTNNIVPFFIRSKSNFLLIKTDYKRQKREAFKLLLRHFKNQLDFFSPSYEKEKIFICDAKKRRVKFLHENKIEYDSNLTKKYCDETIDEDYYFFEAKITFEKFNKMKNELTNFKCLYYGDSIKVSQDHEFESIIQTFENLMS